MSFNTAFTVSSAAAEESYRLYEHMVRPLASQLKRRLPLHVDVEDLRQIGYTALWQLCVGSHFDRLQNGALTFVRMRIRGAMLDSVRRGKYHEANREVNAIRIDEPDTMSVLTYEDPVPDPFLDRLLARSIAGLTGSHQKELMRLRFVEDLTRPEAAAKMGISYVNSVHVERAALAKLRRRLEPQLKPAVKPDAA